MREYQNDAVSDICRAFEEGRDGHILAFDMGLGKTITSLYIARRMKYRTVLVVCPKATIYHWEAEVGKVFGGWAVFHEYAGPGRGPKLDAVMGTGGYVCHVACCTPHTLAADFKGPLPETTELPGGEGDKRARDSLPAHRYNWDLMIVDESHTLRNPSTKLFQAVTAVRRGKTLLLTGTPFNNTSLDLSTQCYLVGAPVPVSLLLGSEPRPGAKVSVTAHLKNRKIEWSIAAKHLEAFREDPTGWRVSVAKCDSSADRRWANLRALARLGYTPETIAEEPRDQLEELVAEATGREPSVKERGMIDRCVEDVETARVSDTRSATEPILDFLFHYKAGELYSETRVALIQGRGWIAGLLDMLWRRTQIVQWNAMWLVSPRTASIVANLTMREVRDQIKKDYFLRRTKAEIPEIAEELKPMDVTAVEVPLDKKQERMHRAYMDDFRTAWSDFKAVRKILGDSKEQMSKLLAILTKWRMCTVSPQLADMKADPPEGEIQTLEKVLRGRLKAGITGMELDTATYGGKPLVETSSKYEMVLNECRRAKESGRKLLVMSGWTTALLPLGELCQAEGINAVQLDGSMSLKARNRVVRVFQEEEKEDDASRPTIDVLLCSIKACGVGLTLTKANRILFLEPQYNPFGEELQAMQRIHRIGQTMDTSATFYLSTVGGERKVTATINGKKVTKTLGPKKSIDHFIRSLQDSKMDSALGLLGGAYLDKAQRKRTDTFEHKGKMAKIASYIED